MRSAVTTQDAGPLDALSPSRPASTARALGTGQLHATCGAITISFVTPLNMEIRTNSERETAVSLVQKLRGALKDTPEESSLLEAIEAWDNKHSQPENSKKNGDTGPPAWMPTLAACD